MAPIYEHCTMPKANNTPSNRMIRSIMRSDMNLLKECIRVILCEEIGPRRLRVFDFDDTLVKTGSKVGVNNKVTGKHFLLTPGEFAVYVANPDEIFDYSDFERLVDPQTIHWTGRILGNIYAKHGPAGVVILTARGNPAPIKQFLNDAGFPGIEVQALGSADPQAKADWIDARISQEGLHLVEFFDDSYKNIAAVKALQDKHPGVKVIVRHIVHHHEPPGFTMKPIENLTVRRFRFHFIFSVWILLFIVCKQQA